MSRLCLFAAIALPALLTGGCGSASQTATPGEAASAAESRVVTVPALVGLTEQEAVKALGAAGLIADVRIDNELPRTAKVDHSVPAPGTDVDELSVVLLDIARAPHPPPVAPEQEEEIAALSRLVTEHPHVFVGLYHDEEQVPHVVFGSRS